MVLWVGAGFGRRPPLFAISARGVRRLGAEVAI